MFIKFILYCAVTVVCVNLEAQRKNVAIVIFNDVQIIDYTGPYEVFGQAGYNVFTAAADTNTIITSMNMKLIPSYSFTNAPKADIIVVPGGGIRHDLPKSDPIVQWILSRQDKAEWILSVCNGAFVLGACGLLDNKRATTTAGMMHQYYLIVHELMQRGYSFSALL